MKITPKKESDLSTGFKNLPDGEYPFTVMESAIAISKSAKNAGKEMVKLKLNVHGDGFDKHVYDYFADWFSEWKLKHFCDTAGLAKEYESGEIDPSNNAYQGRTGFVSIVTETNKETGEERNAVRDYVVESAEPVKKKLTAEKASPTEKDDAPF
jgi:hypothetical protein